MTLTSTQDAALIDSLALAVLRRRFAGELLTPDMAAFSAPVCWSTAASTASPPWSPALATLRMSPRP